ncbi:MAG: AmmeMemoRadiSam system protein B, partial [Gemmatimonadales bacterium]
MTDRRRPAVAGMFYPADPRELRLVVEEMLGEVDGSRAAVRGAIAPHAGLVYSGRCAAQVWGRIVIPPVVVVLAPNHTGRLGHPGGASAWSRGAYATPLGDVPIAEDFLAAVARRTDLVAHDPAAH